MNRLAAVLYALTIYMLISIPTFADEAHLDLSVNAKSNVVQLFKLSEATDMYVRISYRGDKPSVAIISPTGMPCDIMQASPEYFKNSIIYRIPNAKEGQWYLHILVDSTESYEIDFAPLTQLHREPLNVDILVVIGIIIGIVLVFTGYCLFNYKKYSHNIKHDIKHD